MRVLQLIHRKQLRGAEVFASQLSSHLDARGHAIKLASIHRSDFQGDLFYPVFCLEADNKSKWLDYSGWKHLARLCDEFQPDIIQANAGDTLVYAVLSKVIFRWKTPIVYRNASMMSAYLSGGFSRMLYAKLLSYVGAVASVSSATADDLVNVFPFLKEKTIVLPVGINLGDFNAPGAYPESSELNLLHVGGFSFEKNHEGLLRIFKTILSHYPKAILHLVGDGPLRWQIDDLAKSSGLASNLIFHGSVADPFKLVRNAKALLVPSIIEGTPAVILEAFAARIPVVAYNVGGISEWVKPGETGYLVEANNEHAFSESIKQCLEADNTAVLERAHQFAVSNYDNKSIAGQFEQLYAGIINREKTNHVTGH
jgi:glycosyltransferase involved in cell wall biosynthesis